MSLDKLSTRAACVAGLFFAITGVVLHRFPDFPWTGPLIGATLLAGGVFLVLHGEERRRQVSPASSIGRGLQAVRGLLYSLDGVLHIVMGVMSILIGLGLFLFTW